MLKNFNQVGNGKNKGLNQKTCGCLCKECTNCEECKVCKNCNCKECKNIQKKNYRMKIKDKDNTVEDINDEERLHRHLLLLKLVPPS